MHYSQNKGKRLHRAPAKAIRGGQDIHRHHNKLKKQICYSILAFILKKGGKKEKKKRVVLENHNTIKSRSSAPLKLTLLGISSTIQKNEETNLLRDIQNGRYA